MIRNHHLVIVLASCALTTPALAQQGPVRPIQPVPRDGQPRPAPETERPAPPRRAEDAVEQPLDPAQDGAPRLKRKVPVYFDSARASVPFNLGVYAGAGYDLAALSGPSRGLVPRVGALLLMGDDVHFAASISAELAGGSSFVEYGAAMGWKLLSFQANLITDGDSASLGAQLNLHLPLAAGELGDQSALGIFLRPYVGLNSSPSNLTIDGRIAAVAGVELMMMFGLDPGVLSGCAIRGW